LETPAAVLRIAADGLLPRPRSNMADVPPPPPPPVVTTRVCGEVGRGCGDGSPEEGGASMAVGVGIDAAAAAWLYPLYPLYSDAVVGEASACALIGAAVGLSPLEGSGGRLTVRVLAPPRIGEAARGDSRPGRGDEARGLCVGLLAGIIESKASARIVDPAAAKMLQFGLQSGELVGAA